MTDTRHQDLELAKAAMRRGMLEFAVLLIIARGQTYASDILKELKAADLLVVEGTLYPLLNRLRADGLLAYEWRESDAGPPRKYYALTDAGRNDLSQLKATWKSLSASIATLIK